MTDQPPDPSTLDRPWIEAYPPGVPPTYQLPSVALTRFLEDAGRDFPTDEALLAPGRAVIDHATLRERVETLAAALNERGVHPGDRVLVGVSARAAAPTLLALWRLGAVAVPISPATKQDLVVEVVDDADVVGVIGDRGVLDALLERMALPSIAVLADGTEWPDRQPRWRVGRKLAAARVGPRRRATDAPDIATLGQLVETSEPGALPPTPRPDDPALIAYRPRRGKLRGVVLTHANLVANAFQTRLWIPDVQAGRERLLVPDGLHSIVPITLGLLTGLLSAAAVIALDDPSPSDLARAIERDRPTLLCTHPRRLEALVATSDAAKRDLTSLRVVLAVGGPMAADVAAEVERRTGGARVREGYGLAEAGPLTHAQPVYGRVVSGAIGLPVTSTVAAVLDPDDLRRRCDPGEPGLLAVSGPQIASSYWRRAPEDARTFVDGWVVTDDLATVDADGVFRHIARVDDVLRLGGEPVAPRTIEAALERHDEVAQAGVVSDDGSGLLFAAVVVRRRRHRPDPEELLVHCRAHLSEHLIPDRVTLVDELPQDEDGQLDRERLRRDLAGR